jgi:hypothetical protein
MDDRVVLDRQRGVALPTEAHSIVRRKVLTPQGIG